MLLSVPEIFDDYKLEGFEDLYNLIEKANFPKTEILENFLLSAIGSGMEVLSKVDESWADSLVQENLTTVTKTDRV